MLLVQPVSKAQARQRTGRAGRETSGLCYRLYTEEQFEELKEMTVPEIQRCSLASVSLQLMALGITDILRFDFLDQPPQEAIENALEQLVLLGAVRKSSNGHQVMMIIYQPFLVHLRCGFTQCKEFTSHSTSINPRANTRTRKLSGATRQKAGKLTNSGLATPP